MPQSSSPSRRYIDQEVKNRMIMTASTCVDISKFNNKITAILVVLWHFTSQKLSAKHVSDDENLFF